MSKYGNETVNLILDLYSQGKSPYWMVENIKILKDIKPSVIYGILTRNDIRTRKLTDTQCKSRRKYNVNDDYFENIDTPEKAYWLGFIMADGWITKSDNLGITLSKKDEGHLYKFQSAISTNSPVSMYMQKEGYGSGDEYVRIRVSSSKMKKDLIKHGVVEGKTNVLEFPRHILNHLYSHLIRGYFDGDGCITYGAEQLCGGKNFNIKIVGTKDVICFIKDYFGKHDTIIHQRHPNRKANNWTLTLGGNIQVLKILREMYCDSTIHLERKFQRYKELEIQASLSS